MKPRKSLLDYAMAALVGILVTTLVTGLLAYWGLILYVLWAGL